LWHGIGLALAATTVFVSDPQPVGCVGERRFAAVARFVDLELREGQRQILLVEKADGSVFPVDNGEGFAPVALPAEEPVAQLVVDATDSQVPALEPCGDSGYSLFDVQSVKADIQFLV